MHEMYMVRKRIQSIFLRFSSLVNLSGLVDIKGDIQGQNLVDIFSIFSCLSTDI